MFFRDQKPSKPNASHGAKKKILSAFFVIAFGVLLPLSPFVVDFGPNPTGVYRQKATAQTCFNSDVKYGNDNDCDGDFDNDLKAGKCYKFNTGDRQGNGRGYTEIPCPLSSAAIKDKDPVCDTNTTDNISGNDKCDGNLEKGKCYYWGGSTSQKSWVARDCTTKDHPNVSVDDDAGKAPNRCFDKDNKEITCTESTKGNSSLCFRQNSRGVLREQDCATIEAATADTGGDTSADNNATCETTISPLTWLVCPLVNALAETSDFIFDMLIKPLLVGRDLGYTDTNKPLFRVWSSFRTIANILLIIALLVVVFGQTIGGGMVDAYTAKKVLPRILAVAILINISIYLVVFALDVTNIIGAGLSNLIYAPFGQNEAFTLKLGSGAGGIATLGIAAGVGGIWAAGLGGLQFFAVFILLPAVLAIIGAFVTLIIRQGLIVVLIISSPIAFAMYVLPNTEKYFRQWWGLLVKTLMVYPIVMLIFTIADVMAAVLSQSFGYAADWLADLVSLSLLIIPLFLIPYAFKMAGGAIGSLHGALSGMGKQGGEFIKGSANDPTSLRNRTKSKVGENFTRRQQSVIDRGEKIGASRGKRVAGRMAGLIAGNPDARTSMYNAKAQELEEAMTKTGRDALRYAGAGYEIAAGQTAYDGSVSGQSRYFNSKGDEISQAMYSRGKQFYGDTGSKVAAGLEYTVRKAQSSDQIDAMRFALAQNAVAQNWDTAETMDTWAAATYPHKDKWLSEWFSSPEAVKDASGKTTGVKFHDVNSQTTKGKANLDKMVNEGHRAKESFRWGSIRAQDWHAMNDEMVRIQSNIKSGAASQDDKVRYARISENLDVMARQGMITQNSDGEVMVSGATPEASGVIQAMYQNREYATAAAFDSPSGTYSTSDRVLYDIGAVKSSTGPGMSKEAAIQANAVATVGGVSIDRQNIRTQA